MVFPREAPLAEYIQAIPEFNVHHRAKLRICFETHSMLHSRPILVRYCHSTRKSLK